MKNNKIINYLLLVILIAAPVILLILIIRSPVRLIYDENNFIPNVFLLEKLGLSGAFLTGLKNQSPGPLYEFIYYPLKFVGVTTIIHYRLVNMTLLLLGTWLMWRILAARNVESPLLKSLLIFAIPLTWVAGGLALTEVPAIFFALASVYALTHTDGKNKIWHAALSGLFISLAIIGRAPYLMVVPAAAVFFIGAKSTGKAAIAAYFVLALAIPLCVFYVWHGMVPPDVQKIQAGYKPLFVAFTFGYTCFFLLIIYPAWYRLPLKYYVAVLVLMALLVVLNLKFFNITYMPVQTINRQLPPRLSVLLTRLLSVTMPCLMACLMVLHFVALGFQARKSKGDGLQLFLLVAATLIALTTIKSAAQFSTRYPYQAMPFLLLYSARYIKINAALVVRVGVGVVLGIISIVGYFHLHY